MENEKPVWQPQMTFDIFKGTSFKLDHQIHFTLLLGYHLCL